MTFKSIPKSNINMKTSDILATDRVSMERPSSVRKGTAKYTSSIYVNLAKRRKSTVEVRSDHDYCFYLAKKPLVLLQELSSFLTDSIDLPSLLLESAEVLKQSTKASGFNLYMVDHKLDEIYLIRRGSKERRISWKIDEKLIVAAHVAANRHYIEVENVAEDERFPGGVAHRCDQTPAAVLCVPIVTPDDSCIGIVEFYRELGLPAFSRDELKVTIVITGWMSAAIHQNTQRVSLKKQQELNEYLLDLTKRYFCKTISMERMISEVIRFAKKTLEAERGSFYMIERHHGEILAEVFEEGIVGDELHRKNLKTRFSSEKGPISPNMAVPALVARTGETVNIIDTATDPRYQKDHEHHFGPVPKTILCMPIMGAHEIIGVVELINKIDNGVFSTIDEHLFKTFTVYCALALHYTEVQNQLNKTLRASNVNYKTLKRQILPCQHDMGDFKHNPDPQIPEEFHQFKWYVSLGSFASMPRYVLYMILRVVNATEINMDNMMQFILSVKKMYRKNPYHNFEHAFNVCHCMHAILRRNLNKFSVIENKALIIAALCHDLDHGGYTNNFLQLINDDLSQLYEESFLEYHHYRVTMLIMDGCEVYRRFSEAQYKIFLREIKEAILATDLALYFKCRARLAQLCNENAVDWNNSQHRVLIKAIMMTSCDLSGQCKPFNVAKRITDNLYREFYHQGDMEKKMGLTPLSIMDREQQHSIPEDQVQFLTIVVIPCVDLMRMVLPNTEDLYLLAANLRNIWKDIHMAKTQRENSLKDRDSKRGDSLGDSKITDTSNTSN